MPGPRRGPAPGAGTGSRARGATLDGPVPARGRVAARVQAEPEPPGPGEPRPADGATSVARRALGVAGPLALLYAANKQAGVGRVPVEKTDLEWRQALSNDAYYVLRGRGTERAGTSPLNLNKAAGTYRCAGCGKPLFPSASKFNSGTGWPSFYDPFPGAVDLTVQWLYLIGDLGCREVRCHDCGGHLGHMFTDGAVWGTPTGLRYCMNGVALAFEPAADADAA